MNEFNGPRTLVVEDNALLSMMLQGMLQDMGCVIAGAAAEVGEAMDLARGLDIDFAILDLNLGGDVSYPVADLLEQRGIPYIFATGYSQGELPERFDHSAVIAKPFLVEELRQAIVRMLSDQAS